MAEPLLDVCLRRAVQKGPAAEVMPKSMQPAVREADLARRGGKLLFQRLDYLANEDRAHRIGLQRAAARSVEDATIRVVRHAQQDLLQLDINRQRAPPAALERA